MHQRRLLAVGARSKAAANWLIEPYELADLQMIESTGVPESRFEYDPFIFACVYSNDASRISVLVTSPSDGSKLLIDLTTQLYNELYGFDHWSPEWPGWLRRS